ncbi:MAG TPA: MaoC family dehydratase [Bauldia sp.]|nr:MaoC family dehydratase [Bauldia sp.]
MATPETSGAELGRRIGEEIGVSEWIELTQLMIDQFADATMDHQFIHVDPERARDTPFGRTIAHGFLLLSLLSRMSYEALPQIENTGLSLNYGFNRLRFVAAVRVGERIRGRFVLRDATRRADDQLLLTYDVTVEVDGGSKPALVAEWLTLAILRVAAT